MGRRQKQRVLGDAQRGRQELVVERAAAGRDHGAHRAEDLLRRRLLHRAEVLHQLLDHRDVLLEDRRPLEPLLLGDVRVLERARVRGVEVEDGLAEALRHDVVHEPLHDLGQRFRRRVALVGLLAAAIKL